MNKILKTLILFVIVSGGIFAQSYEHLIIYGQSLSTGMQSWPPLSTTALPGNYMIGDQVWINYGNTSSSKLSPLISKMAPDGHSTEPKTTSSMMTCECPIVSVANHLQQKTGGVNKYIATSCGGAGMKIEELSKEYYTNYYTNQFIKTINAAYNLAGNAPGNVHCPALVWMQGEFNYSDLPIAHAAADGLTAGGTFTADKARYKSLLLTLKNNMQNDIMTTYGQSDKPLFITYQTGKQYTKGKTMEIGMAQLEASNENDDMICAGPVYNMPDRGGHLDPNGSRWFGEMMGKVLYKTKVLGETFKPLQPQQIARTADPKVIRVKFLVPVLPLVFETNMVPKFTDYGFQVYLNGTKVTLSSEVINGDCVDLTSTSNLTGDVEIVYAGVASGISQGKGNLRDSDPYTATLNYIDLDKKVNNVFVYERDASATTLRSPVYEPKSPDGSAIYDKPYPLFNFSVAFYYKLNAADQVYNVPNLLPGAPRVKVSGISVTPSVLSVAVGQSATITSSLIPDAPTNSSVLWSSSNPAIAYVINGVVTAVGVGQTVITAKSVDQGFTAGCTVSCTGITEQAYVNATASAINTNIEFENFNKGGEGLAYHDVTPGNVGGLYRNDVNTDITSCTDGGYMVYNTAAGEWLDYSVNIPTTKTYYLKVKYASLSTAKIHFEVNGVNVTGSINLPASYTGTTTVYQSFSIPASLSSGIQNLRFVVESGDTNYNYFVVSETADVNPGQSSHNYYVDFSVTASGDGKSWAKAFKTIAEAETVASLNADPDSVYVKGASFNLSSNWTLKAEKYYFSCGGTETSPSDRPMNDNDGNGIIEPWEFRYPTVLNNTNNGNGPTLVASTVLDGLTIKHTATRSNAALTALVCPVGGTVSNCVFAGSNLTFTDMATVDLGGCLIKLAGTFKNCLVEKNMVSITTAISSTKDAKHIPILEVNTPANATAVSVDACVFRNNQVSITNPSTTSNISYLRGMIFSITGGGTSGNAATKSTVTVSNCLLYNNDASYVGNASYPVATNATIIGTLPFSGSNTTMNILNCTFTNNKLINMKNGCLALYVGGNVSPDYVINNATNNVFWNNQNTTTTTSTTVNCALSSGSAQNPGTILSNNVSDVVASGNWGANLTNTNNLINLSKTNSTVTYGPQFMKISSAVGYIADGSVELADWRLNTGSYLIAKGIIPVSPLDLITLDKAGNAFANPRAAGAYEYMIPDALEIIRNNLKFGTISNNRFISDINAKIEIYNPSGMLIKSIELTAGQDIVLSTGLYVAKARTNEGLLVQKIIIK